MSSQLNSPGGQAVNKALVDAGTTIIVCMYNLKTDRQSAASKSRIIVCIFDVMEVTYYSLHSQEGNGSAKFVLMGLIFIW